MNYVKKKICALEGTSVEMSCYYSHPSGYVVTDIIWYIDYAEGAYTNLSSYPRYNGRLEYNGNMMNQNRHELTIKNLTTSDSVEYMFRIITDKTDGKYNGVPGVTLKITGK